MFYLKLKVIPVNTSWRRIHTNYIITNVFYLCRWYYRNTICNNTYNISHKRIYQYCVQVYTKSSTYQYCIHIVCTWWYINIMLQRAEHSHFRLMLYNQVNSILKYAVFWVIETCLCKCHNINIHTKILHYHDYAHLIVPPKNVYKEFVSISKRWSLISLQIPFFWLHQICAPVNIGVGNTV